MHERNDRLSRQPPILSYAQPQRNDLRKIAVRQRAIMFCILGYIVLIILQFALPAELRPLLGIVALAVVIAAAVFVFMLAIRLFGTAAGIVLGASP